MAFVDDPVLKEIIGNPNCHDYKLLFSNAISENGKFDVVSLMLLGIMYCGTTDRFGLRERVDCFMTVMGLVGTEVKSADCADLISKMTQIAY